MLIVLGAALNIFGAVLIGQVVSTHGQRDPETYGDSWTGDTALDVWSLLLLWSLSWVVWAAICCGKLMSAGVR
ncbi:hypothetical protein [Sphingomonas nostoxanthinifaciens]|uniref:hypothetical protein n=1 Tax=Sphingomonas nostoxanthinifaciens TaxID=2872652 RepID=UPI001CC1C3B0|nr:hypothetical protein [Sphingomonas nostoxanthinifaciens]UAK25654.1 hypothetical protein K8P63_05780 [Sphingomonas nostoxanthinifaciens]